MAASSTDCVFCKIAAGEIPCHRVAETERALAFLDVNPLAEGHTLVIPKAHAAFLEDLDAESAADIARLLGPLAARIQSVVSAAGYNILQNNGAAAGQVVMHVHFHIIPRRGDDGLGYRWNAGRAEPERLAALAGKLRA